MAKGFMVYVEEGPAPKKIHRNFGYAVKEAKQLAEALPDKEVWVIQLHKRFAIADGSKPRQLGTHFSMDSIESANKSDLITKEEFAKRKQEQAA